MNLVKNLKYPIPRLSGFNLKNMKKLVMGLLMLTCLGCEDEQIAWETEDVPQMLVVEGQLTNQRQHHQITLSTSANYFSNVKTPRVTGANLRITSPGDTLAFVEEANQPGVYTSKRAVAGVPGKTYQLDIRLEKPINGRTRYQASQTMPQGFWLDTIQATTYKNPVYVEQAPIDSLVLYLSVLGEEPTPAGDYYTMNLFRNNRPLNDTIDQTNIYSDREAFKGYPPYNFYFFESFRAGDTLELEICSASHAYRRYLNGLQNIVNQSGNPFDLSGPPANAIGNIENGEALGFFRVTYISTARTIVVKE